MQLADGMLGADDVDGVEIQSNVPVRMRDGVVLAADIYRPVVRGAVFAGQLPVLLQRTPYDKTGLSLSEISAADRRPRTRSAVAARFARQGYVVVVQDCRGRFQSEGSFSKYVNESEDGYDTIAWVASQSWCDGRVGTFGLSYDAHVQLAAACLAPPGLACMSIESGGFWDAYQAGIRQGGCFELKQLTWAMHHVQAGHEDAELGRIEDWIWRWPWSEGASPLSSAPEFEAYVLAQWRAAEDGPYWQRPALCARRHLSQISDVPTLLIGSWFDPYAGTMLETFRGLSQTKRSEIALIMGPGTHGRRSDPYAGDVAFGDLAMLDGSIARDYDALRLNWFDRWFKPALRTTSDATVRFFVMGGGDGTRDADGRLQHGGRWEASDTWPPRRIEERTLYLHGDGRLDPHLPHAAAAPLDWTHDPDNPVPTIGGAVTSGEPVMQRGAFHQATHVGILGAKEPFGPLADRDDVLCFETGILDAPLELVGAARLQLFVSSDRPDTDLVVRLIDVHPPTTQDPDGFLMNISHAVLRLRYRDSWTDPTPLQPGRIYPIDLTMFPTANRFDTGHRLRIEVASSSFPHFDPNPGTGDAQGFPGPRFKANNRLYADAERPSRIELPLVPA